MAVRIEADGNLVVALVSGVQLKSREPEALFRASLDRRMSFEVVTQESSHYYLVLDNRRGSEAVKARAMIRVEGERRRAALQALNGYSPRPEKARMSPR